MLESKASEAKSPDHNNEDDSAAASFALPYERVWRPALFWFSFFLLTFLLFLPAYLFNRGDSTLVPPLYGDWPEAARKLLAWRNNLDPFRLSAEFTLLLGVWVFLANGRLPRWRRSLFFLLAATYFLALAYAIYENLSIFFYQEDPVFYAQAELLLKGLPFLVRHLALSPFFLMGITAAILAMLALLFLLLRTLTANKQVQNMGLLSRALLAALLALVLASFFFNSQALAGPKSVVSCLTCKLGHNIASSIATTAQVRAVNQLPFERTYDYGAYSLLTRPDIYMIFVESYGGVLYRRPQLAEPYLALLGELESELANGGWHAATVLSESPSWGGGSWMAYTSALFGLHVDTHPAYLALLERFAGGGYPHLGDTLQKMGYRNARITSLSVELGDAQWQNYKSFYGTDRWLRYSDLGYGGAHYGWGPAPPDQFVLNFANERLQDSQEPLFLFMITQNSHYPWQELPPLVDDWRTLNDGTEFNPQSTMITPKVAIHPDDYMESIRYELQFLVQFILEEADPNALIILAGDHQPGYITRRADGYETPLHIIARDEKLIDNLQEYGFERGLSLDEPVTGIKHEGFYSLFMRVLIDRYGRGDRLLPPYLPNGVEIDNHQ